MDQRSHQFLQETNKREARGQRTELQTCRVCGERGGLGAPILLGEIRIWKGSEGLHRLIEVGLKGSHRSCAVAISGEVSKGSIKGRSVLKVSKASVVFLFVIASSLMVLARAIAMVVVIDGIIVVIVVVLIVVQIEGVVMSVRRHHVIVVKLSQGQP
jgi:hypothetical protein